jgi:hypothetical protein
MNHVPYLAGDIVPLRKNAMKIGKVLTWFPLTYETTFLLSGPTFHIFDGAFLGFGKTVQYCLQSIQDRSIAGSRPTSEATFIFARSTLLVPNDIFCGFGKMARYCLQSIQGGSTLEFKSTSEAT